MIYQLIARILNPHVMFFKLQHTSTLVWEHSWKL